jgi:hypothetical protein
MMRELRWSTLTLAAGLSSCASYNAMWNAERHAKDARQLERNGQTSEARAQWAQVAATAKAGRTDHALVLQAEGLAYSDACREAGELMARARASVQDATLRERIDLADAECALLAGDLERIDATLSAPLASRNADRRSRAEYIAGQSAARRADYEAASLHFDRSREPDAAGRALVAQQQILIARATQRSDLRPIVRELTRLRATVSANEGASRVLDLLTVVVANAPAPRPPRDAGHAIPGCRNRT